MERPSWKRGLLPYVTCQLVTGPPAGHPHSGRFALKLQQMRVLSRNYMEGSGRFLRSRRAAFISLFNFSGDYTSSVLDDAASGSEQRPPPTEADCDMVARTAVGAPPLPRSRLIGFLAILPAELSRPHLKALGR